MYYYWAANIQNIVYWLYTPETDWCQTETNSCFSSSLSALITSILPLLASRYSSYPILISALKMWTQFLQHFKL